MFPRSRTEKQLEVLFNRLDSMQKQIDALGSIVAPMPNPPREKWERRTKPAWENELLDVSQEKTRLLPVPPKAHKLTLMRPGIARVTLCMSGHEQYVNAYDHAGNRIPNLCGKFKDVGLDVLEKAGNLNWEMVAESA